MPGEMCKKIEWYLIGSRKGNDIKKSIAFL